MLFHDHEIIITNQKVGNSSMLAQSFQHKCMAFNASTQLTCSESLRHDEVAILLNKLAITDFLLNFFTIKLFFGYKLLVTNYK